MANTLITPSVVAREALALLYEKTIAAQVVHRDYDANFNGAVGDTITVRRPASFTANVFDRNAGITVQNATETSFTVTLDTLLDVSFAVTAEDLTLKVDDFSGQFILPAVEAIQQGIDSRILAVLVGAGVTQSVGTQGTTPTDPRIVIDAAKILNDNKVPRSDRYAIITTAAEANFVKDPLFLQAERRGDTQGVQDASIGHKLGFDFLATTNLPSSGTPAGDSVAFHKSACALVSRTLAIPEGVAPGLASVVSDRGFGIRCVKGYDQTKKQDVISLDILIGVKLLDASRAVKIAG